MAQHRTITRTTAVRTTTENGQKNGTTIPAVESWWRMAMVGVAMALLGSGGVRLNAWMVSIADRQQQAAWRDYYHVDTFENFVTPNNTRLWTDLHNESLWRACDKITKGATRFWYMHKTESPKNVFEEMAVQIYRNTPYWDQAASFEYWCNVLEVNEEENDAERLRRGAELHWHTDRDEDILERERRLVTPLRGAVYYGYPPFEGGQFHIVNSVPYNRLPIDGSAAVQPSPSDECDPATHLCVTNPSHLVSNDSAFCVPVQPNLLLMANVTYFHKVTPLRSGKRFSLAVNADHWLPYEDDDATTTNGRQRHSLTNEELLRVADSRDDFPKRQRTIWLTTHT